MEFDDSIYDRCLDFYMGVIECDRRLVRDKSVLEMDPCRIVRISSHLVELEDSSPYVDAVFYLRLGILNRMVFLVRIARDRLGTCVQDTWTVRFQNLRQSLVHDRHTISPHLQANGCGPIIGCHVLDWDNIRIRLSFQDIMDS
jgi:hypothetical protein